MLWRKMIRDIWSNKGSYFACLVIVIIGLVAFTTFSIVTDNLSRAQETFYREQNFAHGFVELVSMPESNVQRLVQIEGIKDINGRIVKDVRVNAPDREESVYLELVSWICRPPGGQRCEITGRDRTGSRQFRGLAGQ